MDQPEEEMNMEENFPVPPLRAPWRDQPVQRAMPIQPRVLSSQELQEAEAIRQRGLYRDNINPAVAQRPVPYQQAPMPQQRPIDYPAQQPQGSPQSRPQNRGFDAPMRFDQYGRPIQQFVPGPQQTPVYQQPMPPRRVMQSQSLPDQRQYPGQMSYPDQQLRQPRPQFDDYGYPLQYQPAPYQQPIPVPLPPKPVQKKGKKAILKFLMVLVGVLVFLFIASLFLFAKKYGLG